MTTDVPSEAVEAAVRSIATSTEIEWTSKVRAAVAAASPFIERDLRAQWEAKEFKLGEAIINRDIQIANLQAELAKARQVIEAVRAAHRSIALYEVCTVPMDRYCENDSHVENTEDGGALHLDDPLGDFCGACRDEDGERLPWPCPTVRLLPPVVAPAPSSACASCGITEPICRNWQAIDGWPHRCCANCTHVVAPTQQEEGHWVPPATKEEWLQRHNDALRERSSGTGETACGHTEHRPGFGGVVYGVTYKYDGIGVAEHIGPCPAGQSDQGMAT